MALRGEAADVVYVGYTPGYPTTYVYGGTVVYGTGFYYPGWYGPTMYYAYPSTWGFHVRYHPYRGWSYGLSYTTGRFTFGIGYTSRWYPYGYRGGLWGPAGRYGYRGGYRRGYARGYARGARNANIYNHRRNVARNTVNGISEEGIVGVRTQVSERKHSNGVGHHIRKFCHLFISDSNRHSFGRQLLIPHEGQHRRHRTKQQPVHGGSW